MDNKKNAIVLLSNKFGETIESRIKKLENVTTIEQDTFFLFHQESGHRSIPTDVSYLKFCSDDLHKIGLFTNNKSLIPGIAHYPLILFYLKNPHYDYYWFIEDDVVYNGDWNNFFPSFINNSSDFVACRPATWTEEPEWYWWNSLKNINGQLISNEEKLRTYNPIFRMSKSAISFIYQSHLQGWVGHNEVLFPTLLVKSGFSIDDLNSKPEKRIFYTTSPKNKLGLITTGTMRYRPAHLCEAAQRLPGMLYHPLKNFT